MQVILRVNQSIIPSDMEENAIYLDGSCKGYFQDFDKNSISFDHHAGCIRTITLATCEQVHRAIELGFDPTNYEKIIIDDIDADTVLSVWLLQNPDMIHDDLVTEVTRLVGFVDTNGPMIRAPHPLHYAINPHWSVTRTEKMLLECLKKATDYFEGELELEKGSTRPGRFAGFNKKGEVYIIENTTFVEMYTQFPLVLGIGNTGDTNMFTLGKISEFFNFNMKPVFDQLAKMEEKKTDALELLTKNWGGSTTIGGSARYSDKSNSRLDEKSVIDVIRNHLKN